MNNPQNIVQEVLTIIDYQGDREQMAQTFLQLVNDQAILTMIDNLDSEKKSEFLKKANEQQLDENSPEFATLAKEYFTDDLYVKAVKDSTEKLFAKYLTELMPTLSTEQQDKLFGYLGSLSPQTA